LPAPLSSPSHRSLVLIAILALHVLAIYALAQGFSPTRARLGPMISQVQLIQYEKPQPPTLLAAPPRLSVDLYNFRSAPIVAPEITLRAPVDPPAPAPMPAASVEQASVSVSSAPSRGAGALLTRKPRAVYVPNGRDRYPPNSIRAKESGEPIVTICISASGAIESVQIAKSSGYGRLDQAAVGIGEEARFKPAMQNGDPVAACMNYRIRFAIEP
jgi:periplasmic protein TonB